MKYFIKTITKYPFLTVAVITLITIFLGYNIKNLRIETDILKMLPEDNPVRIAQEAMEDEFGIPDMIIIGLVTENIFNTDFLTKIKELSKRLKKIRIESDPFKDPNTGKMTTKKRKGIEDVTSLSTIDYIQGTEEGMEVSDLMEYIPKSPEEMNQLKDRLLSWDFYIRNVVSSDLKATAVAVECKRGLSNAEMARVAKLIEQTIREVNFDKNVGIYIAGTPFASAAISSGILKDNSVLIPLAFCVVIIALLITMRRVSNVIMIVLTIAGSVIWTMGFIAAIGYELQMLTSFIPIVLVAIGSAYSIHIVNHYTDELAIGRSAVEAVENSLQIVGRSVFAAALTTVAGFLSLMASDLTMIRKFGLFTAIGTVVAFIVSVIFVPAALLVFARIFKKQHQKNTQAGIKPGIDLVPFLQMLAEKVTRQKKLVLTITALLTCAAVIFTFQVRPGFYLLNSFKKDSEIRKADAVMCEKFGGTNTVAIVIEADSDDYFKRPEALRKLDRLKQYMQQDPETGLVISLSDIIKRMNYVMNENKKAYDAIPETKQHVAQYLLLHADPEALEGMVTWDYRKARVVVLLKEGDTETLKRINQRILDWAAREIPELKISLTGRSQMSIAFNDLVIEGQIKTLILSTPTVFIIAAIVLNSLVAGFLAIIPLSISVFLNFGILGLTGTSFDAAMAIIASIAIGIGVDYAIHLLHGVRHGFITKGPENAVREGINITGNAIVFNAASVAFGFLVLVFSSFNDMIKLGGFTAVTMFTSSAGTLLLLPVLIDILPPKFLKRNEHGKKRD